jgi:hypothetical protein
VFTIHMLSPATMTENDCSGLAKVFIGPARGEPPAKSPYR